VEESEKFDDDDDDDDDNNNNNNCSDPWRQITFVTGGSFLF
jgi:hypothetical protein